MTLLAMFVKTLGTINVSAAISVCLTMFSMFAVLNGYVSASFYKFFKGTNWILLSIISSTGLFAFYTSCLTVIEVCELIETKKLFVSEISAIL